MSRIPLSRYCLAALCAVLVAGCETLEETQPSGGGTGPTEMQLSPEAAQQLKIEEERARAEADAEVQARVQALLDRATEAFVKGGIAERSGQPEEALSQFTTAFHTHAQAINVATTHDQQMSIAQQHIEDRKKIIAVALQLPAPPPAPEDARKETAFAMAALKEAQTDADLREVAAHFSRALRLAPWLAGVYYNLAIVEERLHEYDSAVVDLRYCLLAAPRAADAQAVQEKIYGLEFEAKRRDQRQGWLGLWDLSGPVKHSYVDQQFGLVFGSTTIHDGPTYLSVYVDEIGRDGHAHGKILYDQDKFKDSTAPEVEEAKYQFYPYPFSIEAKGFYGAGAADWRGTWTADQLVLEWTPPRPDFESTEGVTIHGHGRLEMTKQDGGYHAALACSCKLQAESVYTMTIEDSYAGEVVRTRTLKNPPKD